MQNNLIRKSLAFGLFVLFVGVCIIPIINGDGEDNNKSNIDINPFFNDLITKKSIKDTKIPIINRVNSKGWSTTEVISTESTGNSFRPSSMVDNTGVLHVAWFDNTDYGGSGEDGDIFYKYRSSGGTWSAVEVVSTESTEYSYRASLMVDLEGVLHVAWQDQTNYDGSGSDTDIFYKYKPSGGTWSTTEVVSTDSTEDSFRPSIMVDHENAVHVAWFDITDYGGSGEDEDIFYKYKPSGGTWSTTEVVSTESTEDSTSPSLEVDHENAVHVAWYDFTDYGGSGEDEDIFYKYKPSGGTWSTTELVSTESTNDSRFPSLMIDNDMVHITWTDTTIYGGASHDRDIFYKYKNGGGSWSITEVVSTESHLLSDYPSLIVDSNDIVHIAWNDNTDYDGCDVDKDIFYKYKNDEGVWSATQVVSTESTDVSMYPSLAVDDEGIVHVVWTDYSDYGGSGIDKDIFYKFKNSGNQSPNTPDIKGPSSGKTGISYEYIFSSIDHDDDIVRFFIDWGNGETEWTDYVQSGTPLIKSHIWSEKNTYEIKAKAKDTDGRESGWGKLSVSMPRATLFTNTIFMRFFERHPNLFHIIRDIYRLKH